MNKKGGLGKGLGALFTENETDPASAVTLRISEIEPNRDQPRKEFDAEALTALSDSIARHGVLQPLLVRPLAGGGYQLVAGERRWRAARMAGLSEVPAVIREMTENETMELALIENLQREDLNPLEEAEGYRNLTEKYGLTQEEISERVGKSRSAVANALRLLSLPDKICALLRSGQLSAGHGRALLAFEDEDLREKAVRAALAGASVRELERMAKAASKKPAQKSPAPRASAYHSEVSLALSETLGRRVSVRTAGKKNCLEIEFYSDEELKDLAFRLAGETLNK